MSPSGPQIFGCVYCLLFLGLTSFVMWKGVDLIETANEYKTSGTEEQCLLTGFDATACSYDCRCTSSSSSSSSSSRKCDTCYGTRYEYYAKVHSKCGNETLYQETSETLNCPMTFRGVNIETKCYVLDCDSAEFSLRSSTTKMVWGVLLTVLASFLFCCALCCICAGIGRSNSKLTTDSV